MARKPIDIGTIGNDGTGDSIRDAFRKVNDNFRELYSSLGLGERLTFIGLDDTPDDYTGQENSLVTVGTEGLVFKELREGQGISLDFSSDNSIIINNKLADISGDPAPNLGGPLSAVFGLNRFPIGNIPDLRENSEISSARGSLTISHDALAADPDRLAVNKGYADTKISLAGVDSLDPASNFRDTSFGQMTGPLVLSRDPLPEDDVIWQGRVAATKRYVDNAGFGSVANLYVATSGSDDRSNVTRELQGRALSFAYRTIEAACKRAEELLLEAPIEMGPYKKVLTYNDGADQATLKYIGASPGGGTGFVGQVFMSADDITLDIAGNLYRQGDLLDINGGTFIQRARIEVLSVNVIPGTDGRGSIRTFRVITPGVYTVLPGSSSLSSSNVDPTITGSGARFNITYRVNKVEIASGDEGSGYGLVSVRFEGGGGSGAFGRADVLAGQIVGITVTSGGSGFTSLPTLKVDLPRFFIETQGQRTDFTGNVISSTPEALRTRDIREGLLLRGETSGAIAQILGHSGELSSLGADPLADPPRPSVIGSEIFDVDLLSGEFIVGEEIAYGDVTKPIQICIFVEAGIYEENLPLRVPQNVAVIGDEFRRTIIRPRRSVDGAPLSGMSTSPWAFLPFRRDPAFDGMTVTEQLFGYHYLSDPTEPVYPLINNRGSKRSAAQLLDINREFIKSQVIGWINYNLLNPTGIWLTSPPFTYDQELCRRDVGLIVDALVFDLKYGGYSRTISAALKYFQSVSAVKAITPGVQLSQTSAAIQRINTLAQSIILNAVINEVYTDAGDRFLLDDPASLLTLVNDQFIDQSFVAESSSGTIISELVDAIVDIITNSGAANYPKDNTRLDVFLMNDADIIRAVTCQGAGGFMMVLDPEGQILTKSPYCQESACFSQSTGRKTFAGGMFVDGFTGNQQFRITAAPEISPGLSTLLEIDGLLRPPQTPCSFIVGDTIYRINYIRNYNYAVEYPTEASDGTSQWYSSAQFILDETTPWPFGVFSYDQEICRRDTGLILDGVGYDIVFQTNYNQRKAGFLYRQANAAVVIADQLDITTRAITFAHELAIEENVGLSSGLATEIRNSAVTINTILEVGVGAAPSLVMTSPPGLSTDLQNAKTLLLANIDFIRDETIGWINDQVSGSIAPFDISFVYDSLRYSKDVGNLIEALVYDLIYGGNSQTRDAALKYYDGVGDIIAWQLGVGAEDETAAAVDYASYLCQRVIQNLAPVATYSSTPRVTGTPATATEASTVLTLLADVSDVIVNGVSAVDPLVLPNLNAYSYNATRLAVKTTVDTERTSIQNQTVFFVNLNGNQYEVLMPGNRSMLSNDFTQVNDLGYGLVVANGGLTEAVSMFTYYCQIAYYALTGGQIRSIGGSSSHGNFALVAEGSDPLEVPTPVGFYHRLAQGATVIANTVATLNAKASTVLHAQYDDYLPLPGTEIEINHNGRFTRYAVTSTDSISVANRIAKLNISSAGGLESGVPHGQRITIRQNSFVVLTGDVVDVATRPSTALILNEAPLVYRVLEFNDYNEIYDKDTFTITNIDLVSGVITTDIPHRQVEGYQIKIRAESTDVLPSAIVAVEDGPPEVAGEIYYINSVVSANQFTIAVSPVAAALDISAGPAYGGSTTATMLPYGLALTQLRENYSYIPIDLYLFQPFRNPSSLTACTFTLADPTVIGSVGHGLTAGTQIRFDVSTAGILPGGIESASNYWVVNTDLAADTFKITDTAPIGSTQIGIGGVLDGLAITGLTATERLLPGMRLIPKGNITGVSGAFVGTTVTLTFSEQIRPPYLLEQEIVVSGFADTAYNGTVDVINCTTTTVSYNVLSAPGGTDTGGTISVSATGNLGTAPVIASITNSTTIVISNSGGNSNGTVVFDIDPEEIGITGAGSGTFSYGLLIGDQGQDTVAVTPLPDPERARILNTVLVYDGIEYIITGYQHTPGGELYSLITLDQPLVTSAANFDFPILFKAAVPVPSTAATGTLTIRIALVRVTGHDFLEIGTGSYADTNYPAEIFGAPVNDFNTVPLYSTDFSAEGQPILRSQVQERDVGRAFFVTTDQYGNFSVGPFFKVDQGTGTVTFSASIALSQLDGLGFKRGSTVSEFSVDDGMADAANDAVPTEGAVRGYIDRRLGLTHSGVPVLATNLIPIGDAGGFMALSGQLAMKGDMDLGDNLIRNLAEPVLGNDAARLDTINLANLKDLDGNNLFTFTEIQAGQILAFTGDGNKGGNFTAVGDVAFDINPGDSSVNYLTTSISPDVIVDADINSAAGILQSKLAMNSATIRANATGITQADKGLASFDSSQFDATDGWISVKTNGIIVSNLQQIPSRNTIGYTGIGTGTPGIITFSTLIDNGDGNSSTRGALFREAYDRHTVKQGYLKRTGGSGLFYDEINHFTMVADSNLKVNNALVVRDNAGGFAAGIVTVDSITLATGSGNFSALRPNVVSAGVSGFTELLGYGGAGGSTFVGVGIGAGVGNQKTQYNNTSHEFRSQVGTTTFATIDTNGVNIGTRTLTCGAITTGSATTSGTITGQWILADTPGGSTRTNSRLQATYAADLAEFYEGDQEYDVGTVLIFGGEKEVTASNKENDHRVAGVVSDNAAYSMYGACPGFKNQIALQGRVPVKVIGKISKGDILVTSEIPGVAKAAQGEVRAGTMIGKAIENYDSDLVGIMQVSVGRT
jgi:hypothetical protein